jgi:hypothetical protein
MLTFNDLPKDTYTIVDIVQNKEWMEKLDVLISTHIGTYAPYQSLNGLFIGLSLSNDSIIETSAVYIRETLEAYGADQTIWNMRNCVHIFERKDWYSDEIYMAMAVLEEKGFLTLPEGKILFKIWW